MDLAGLVAASYAAVFLFFSIASFVYVMLHLIPRRRARGWPKMMESGMEEKMKEMAQSLVNLVLDEYHSLDKVAAMNRLLDSATDIRICMGLTRGGWYLDEVVLTMATGGPNEYIIIRENEIVGRICWGGKCVDEVKRTREANEVLDLLEEVIAHRVW